MNPFIKSQITNIVTMTQAFKQGCQMAAKYDDGSISKDEAKTLKKIEAIADKFTSDLLKLK